MIDGGGYPSFRFRRDCHYASRLVHVCDVYDALRTKRPYRDAWPSEKVRSYLEERAGSEFDPDLIRSFSAMMDRWETRITRVDEATEIAASRAEPGTAGGGTDPVRAEPGPQQTGSG
jgi:response regulator RpfG family c-di-GMP phosphodiesterase